MGSVSEKSAGVQNGSNGPGENSIPDRCSDSPTPAALSRSNIEIWGQGKEGRGIHRIS
ncbi:hypothetical protein ACKVV7_005426 [Pyricularia oryzae]